MANITGKVYRTTGKSFMPIEGALVGIQKSSVPHRDLAAKTDANGSFSLEGLAPGTYVIGAAGSLVQAEVDSDAIEIRCDIEAKDTAYQVALVSDSGNIDGELEKGGIGAEDEEKFASDPYDRESEDDVQEAAEISLIDKGLVYAVLSLKLAAGLRDRDALTDAAYAALHPDDLMPFSTDDPEFDRKSQEWLDLRREVVAPLLVDIVPEKPSVTSVTAFGLQAMRMPDGTDFKVRRNGINWALPKVVEAAQTIAAIWHTRHPDVTLWFLDMSREQGGRLYPPHKSHSVWCDYDCQLRIGNRKLCMSNSRYPEWRPLWQELVDITRANGVLPVKVIGFSDRKIKGVSSWNGHGCHLHVRMCAPPDQIDKVEAAVDALYADQPRNKRPNYRGRADVVEASALPTSIEPAPDLYPVDYLDVEENDAASVAGLTLVQRGLAYAAIGIAYARGLRKTDELADEGWKTVYPDAPFPLRSWHEGFAERRRAWLEIREMVSGFLNGVADTPSIAPALPTTCTRWGRAELTRLAQEAEAAGAPEGFAKFAEAAAWTESRWDNCAINDSPSEAAAALRLFEGAQSRGWFQETTYDAEKFGFGSGGWFGLMPATGLIAGGSRGPFVNADPRIVTNPVESVVMVADFCVRIFRKYQAKDWLAVRRAMAALSLVNDSVERNERSIHVRERFEVGLEKAGVVGPAAFMRRRPATDGYPGAWALWLNLGDLN